jgi:hypothetical protein
MKIRGGVLIALILCVLGGLIAAVFTPAIAATLALPTTSGAGQAANGMHPQATAPVTMSAPAPTAQPTALANGVTVLAQDSFQRPDQTFWGTSSGLRPWGGDANTNAAFSIVNHVGQISGKQAAALQATLNVESNDAELLVSGSVSQFDAKGNANLGIVLRWQDANNWYKALIDGTNLQLLKAVNGKISVISQHAFAATSGANYSIRFRVLGSNLFAKAWLSSRPEPANWTLMMIDTQLTTGMSGVRVKVAPGVVIRVTRFLETSVPNPMQQG